MLTNKITINNISLAFMLSESQSGQTLVFLHGAGSTNQVWQAQWSYFKDKMKVLVPDLPGHGGSSGSSSDTVDAYANTIIELAAKLNLQQFIMIGHSMGGAIAQKVAVLAPELLSGLVLVATGAKLRVMPQVFSAIETDYKQYVELAATFSMSESADERQKALFKDILSASAPSAAYNDFKACDKFDALNEVGGITVPALIIAGGNDMMTPLKYSQFLNQKIAGSRLEIVDGAGHMVMMEKPDQVNQAIERFITAIR